MRLLHQQGIPGVLLTVDPPVSMDRAGSFFVPKMHRKVSTLVAAAEPAGKEGGKRGGTPWAVGFHGCVKPGLEGPGVGSSKAWKDQNCLHPRLGQKLGLLQSIGDPQSGQCFGRSPIMWDA